MTSTRFRCNFNSFAFFCFSMYSKSNFQLLVFLCYAQNALKKYPCSECWIRKYCNCAIKILQLQNGNAVLASFYRPFCIVHFHGWPICERRKWAVKKVTVERRSLCVLRWKEVFDEKTPTWMSLSLQKKYLLYANIAIEYTLSHMNSHVYLLRWELFPSKNLSENYTSIALCQVIFIRLQFSR